MKSVSPSEARGIIEAPPSKSMTVRAIAAALLSRRSEIWKPSFCDDAIAAIGIARAMGAEVSVREEAITLRASPSQNDSAMTLECGESGLCIRMFAPIAALSGGETVLSASGSLASRPMATMEQLNGHVTYCRTEGGYAPVTVKGPLRGGILEIDASLTSQFLTGLLMALPLCGDHSTLLVPRMSSLPYVKMTVSLLSRFGIEIEHEDDWGKFFIRGNQTYGASSFRVEGDWSSAAFLLVAGAVAGCVRVSGLDSGSFQADRAVMDALVEAGAKVTLGEDYAEAEKGELKPFTFDASDAPDLFPPLVALAAHCPGTSVIHGAERLRHKESDRAAALAGEFGKLGIAVSVCGDRMEVKGGVVRGAHVDSHNDHRIAMACAVAALNGKETTFIDNPGSVAKSYPDFFRDLSLLQEAS